MGGQKPVVNQAGMMIQEAARLELSHAVEEVSPAQFSKRMARFETNRRGAKGTAVFTWVDGDTEKHFVIGDQAVTRINSNAMNGRDKYTRDYWLPLTLAPLSLQYPEGGDFVICTARPADAAHLQSWMMDVLRGKHTIRRLDGKEVTYRIRYVAPPVDEPQGGAVFAANHISALKVGIYGVADIGNGVSTLAEVEILPSFEVEVRWRTAGDDIIRTGIKNVKLVLQSELEANYEETFRSGVDERIIESIIRQRGKGVFVADRVYDFVEEFERATSPLIKEFNTVYRNVHRGLQVANGVIYTGGGSASTKELFDEEVFYNRKTWFADYPVEIQFANVKGVAYQLGSHFSEHMPNLPKLTQLVHDTNVRKVCLDLGNGNLKLWEALYFYGQ